ncbi:phosphotransferase [Microbacterium protaetiae]
MDRDPLSLDDLRRVGSIVRTIHDASAQFTPPENVAWESAIPTPGRDLVCHNDLAPWNLIIGERWVFIDWDAAAPSTRLWDLAYAAQAFTLNDPNQSPHPAAQGLAAFVDGYRADEATRTALPAEMGRRATAMRTLLESSASIGLEPWASMHANGHGAHWAAVSHYVEAHQDIWLNALAD